MVVERPPRRADGPAAGAARRSPTRVRAVAGVPVAAVLVVPALPTDIRHNSKIDRARGRPPGPTAVLAGG